MHLIGRRLLILLWLGAAQAETTGVRVTGASSSLAGKTQVMEWSGAMKRWTNATFQPASAMDGSLATSWCEGAPGSGVGEWLEIEATQAVTEVEIAGGFRKVSLPPLEKRGTFSEEQLDDWFDKSLRTYKSNSRPAVIELTTEKGQVLERFQMGDRTLSRYRFPVSLSPGRYRLRISRVYPGARFEDTCIAELQFREGPQQVPLTESSGPLALLSLRERCRAGWGVKVLPQEVMFLGRTASSVSNSATSSGGRFYMAVRSPAGFLLPITDTLTCTWGLRSNVITCDAEGEDTEHESLGGDEAYPSWSVKLLSDAAEAYPQPWSGEYEARSSPSRTTDHLQVDVRPDAKEAGAFVVSASRDNAVVETASYTCVRLP